MDLLLVDQANTSNMFGLQSSTHHRVRREQTLRTGVIPKRRVFSSGARDLPKMDQEGRSFAPPEGRLHSG